MRKFRFGVQARGFADAGEWRELARRAEGLGYDVFSLPDHFDQGPAPMVALAFAAEATTTLRLDADQALASPHSMIGTVEEVVDKLVRQREELDISYIGLSIESMEDMAPVVARLAGT
ncbi:MAG: LLM class flavin-dependent oxidoreductase [bacterium]|nr:LLM class flavin-dependent oxidoreductase [bacterium]